MISAYYKFIALPDEVKKIHKIRSKHRLDCVKYNDHIEFKKSLSNFINHKGQLFFFLTKAIEFVKADSKRITDLALTNGQNFTSLYIEDLDFQAYAYGDYGNEGLLFILNPGFTVIEMVVVKNGRNLIRLYYQKLIDGELDQEIDYFRDQAKPFFNYGL